MSVSGSQLTKKRRWWRV